MHCICWGCWADCTLCKSLQSMLNVCNNIAEENGLHFNAIKTVCMKYHSKCHTQGPVNLC